MADAKPIARATQSSALGTAQFRPKQCDLSFNDPLCQLIARKLRRKWSPQQIAPQCPERREADLIAGSNNSYIATLVERHSRFVMLAKVTNKATQSVTTALKKQARKLPKELYKSRTWDRGSEMSAQRKFTMATNTDVYFCDPQSPLSSKLRFDCWAMRGNAGAMKIPTAFSHNTSPK
ncbi:MAG: IS30 family transposase, partial [Paracoccaceae bacterium]